MATSALGMGFDKGDLGFVIHLGAPSSPISYYQQVGRAGRATATADVVLLPGADDVAIWDYFASLAFPRRSVIDTILDTLAAADRPTSTPALEASVDLTARVSRPRSRSSMSRGRCAGPKEAGRSLAAPGTTTRNATPRGGDWAC